MLRKIDMSNLVGAAAVVAIFGASGFGFWHARDDVAYEPSQQEVSARVLGADEHLRGSGNYEGGGFIGWSSSGSANVSGDAEPPVRGRAAGRA